MKSTSQSLRASLLLPQDFSLFVKWQKEHESRSDIGQVRDALEYHRFIRHRDALISGNIPPPVLINDPQIASECGHTVHPSDTIRNELCPVCEVAAHLAFLHIITVAWNKAGGPRLRPGTHVTGKFYAALRAGWHMARLQFQELLDMFAILTMYEEEWETKHPFEAAAARRTNCASVAIRLAQVESRYPARLSPVTVKMVKRQLLREKKSVTFAPEVLIHDDRVTYPSNTKFSCGRLNSRFCRSGLAYQPGNYACPAGSDYIDTSQMTLLSANLSNLKIYITDDEDAFDSLQASPRFYGSVVGDYQDIVGLHKLSDDIFLFIHDYLTQDQGQKEELEGLVEEADRVVVLIDEETGGVVDLFLYDGSDEDEEEENNDEHVDEKGKGTGNGDWTCLRECLS